MAIDYARPLQCQQGSLRVVAALQLLPPLVPDREVGALDFYAAFGELVGVLTSREVVGLALRTY